MIESTNLQSDALAAASSGSADTARAGGRPGCRSSRPGTAAEQLAKPTASTACRIAAWADPSASLMAFSNVYLMMIEATSSKMPAVKLANARPVSPSKSLNFSCPVRSLPNDCATDLIACSPRVANEFSSPVVICCTSGST
jgi:hypothetical protein